MKNIRKYNFQNKQLKDNGSLFTIIASFLSSIIILSISSLANSFWQSYLISLSASILAIGIAIIIVDLIRSIRLEAQYKLPRTAAINKIIAAHSLLALILATKNIVNDESIIKEILSNIKNDQSAQNFLKLGSVIAIEKLSRMESDVILNKFSHDDISQTLKQSLDSIGKTYSEINNMYIYSFNNIPMRTSYTELVEDLNTLVGWIAIETIDDNQLNKLFTSTETKGSKKKITSESLIGSMLISYLKKYIKFLQEYSGMDDSSKIQKSEDIL